MPPAGRAGKNVRSTLNRQAKRHDQWPSTDLTQGNKAMTITKTALAAAILAVMAVSAQAQQGPTRQIQVLPAPKQVALAPANIADSAPAKVDGQAPVVEAADADAAPAEEAAPEVAPKVAPKLVAPKFAPKVIVAEPKFVEPKLAPPVRKVSYGHGGYGGYGKRNCH
jgi:hypothetical protein